MNITQIDKRIAAMQYCMRQEVDKALDNDATYRECQEEYNKAVRAWRDSRTNYIDLKISGSKSRAEKVKIGGRNAGN